MLKSLLRRAAAALGLTFLLVAGTSEAKPPRVAHPALWEVSDPDTTIYLFGTIHLLPEHYQWRTAKFNQALDRSQKLVVETIVDDKNPTKLMTAMAAIGFAKGLPPISTRVSPDKQAALDAAIKKSGVPRMVFDQMKTWTAGFTLLSLQFRDMGLKGADGVEAVLREKFTTEGKPIGELETNIEQLSFFDTLPEKAQRALLEGALGEQDGMDAEFSGMLDAWARGDVKGIARTFDRDLAASPELQQALIRKRNANWSKWISKRMAEPGSVMVAVGAGHLAGPESVIAMLKQQGLKVRQIQ